jgi:hypothetical protein
MPAASVQSSPPTPPTGTPVPLTTSASDSDSRRCQLPRQMASVQLAGSSRQRFGDPAK